MQYYINITTHPILIILHELLIHNYITIDIFITYMKGYNITASMYKDTPVPITTIT